jgi:hypothetical protein
MLHEVVASSQIHIEAAGFILRGIVRGAATRPAGHDRRCTERPPLGESVSVIACRSAPDIASLSRGMRHADT